MIVGLFTPSWPGDAVANGITTSVAFMVEGLEAIGVKVLIFSADHYEGYDPRVFNLPERPLTLHEKVSYRLSPDQAIAANFAARLSEACRLARLRYGLDVLVMEETQGWGAQVQRQLGLPVVLALHGPWFLNYRDRRDHAREDREGRALAACSGVISPSRNVRDMTLKRYGLSNVPNQVVPNPISLKAPIDYDKLSEGEFRQLLFVGRFDRIKGADIVLQAFNELVRNGAEARLTVVGKDVGLEGPDGQMQNFLEFVSSFPSVTQRRIDFAGLCSKPTIDQMRQSHGVAIVGSRFEIFPYVVMESLAAGVATVATDVGGVSEIIRDGETGVLVPSEDPNRMAHACLTLLNNRSLCRSLGTTARQDMHARFSPREIARQLVSFLETVVR